MEKRNDVLTSLTLGFEMGFGYYDTIKNYIYETLRR